MAHKKDKKTSKNNTLNRTIASMQAEIRHSGFDRYRGIHRFRAQADPKTFLQDFRTLFPLKNSLHDFFGPAFPRKVSDIHSNHAPKAATNAHREILWAIGRSLTFHAEIRQFIQHRDELEKQIALDDWESSHLNLSQIDEKFGKSIWWYQNRLAISYLANSPETPFEIAEEITKEIKDNPIVSFAFFFIRKRVESAVLRGQLIEELETNQSGQNTKDYIRAKCIDNSDSRAAVVTALLFHDAQSSLIDHYESLVQALQVAASDEVFGKDLIASSIRPSLRQLLKATNDLRLLGPLAASGDCSPPQPTEEFQRRANIIELYTKSEYRECISAAEVLLLDDPTDTPIRVLNAKARAALEIRPEQKRGILNDIDQHLFDIFAATDKFFIGLHSLLVLADRFFNHHLTNSLKVVALYEIGHEEVGSPQSWQRDVYIRDTHITPFTTTILSDDAAKRLLSAESMTRYFPATCVIVQALNGNNPTPDLSDSRILRYSAREHLCNKNYPIAANRYLLAAQQEKNLSRLRSLGGAAIALALAGDLKRAVDTVVNAYFENPNAPTALPFKDLIRQLADPKEWPNTINLGILQELHAQNSGEVDLSPQRLAFEKYCLDNSISSPSVLGERINVHGEKSTITYLEKVWRPEIMRQTLLYEHDNDIEEARIEACKVLARINPSNAREYQEELAARIKQQEISKATALVESSRVYVDIEAIKRSLRGKIGKTYAQYKSSASHLQKTTDGILEKMTGVLSGIDAASLPILLSTLHIVGQRESTTPADLQFNVMFTEITKEFLQGDHGLNAYLSTRVRHGKLVDALRKPVMDEHLVTQRTTDKKYATNTFWNKEIGNTPWGEILNRLDSFANAFDSVLAIIRDQLIQIQIIDGMRPKGDESKGLFIYRSSELERRLIQSYDEGYKDLDELIGRCVDSLWEKTDFNLQVVRDHLDDKVRSSLIAEFDKLTSDLRTICLGPVPGALSSAIARARTATQQALDGVIGWFKRSEVYDRHDYDADFPPRIAASMVARTMSLPSTWNGPTIVSLEQDAKLPGRSLDGMVDMFYVLFENAVKHFEQEGIAPNVSIEIKYVNEDFQCSVTSTARRPTSDQLTHLQMVRETLATAESRRLAQMEGRSGFRKIWMTLDNPLYKSPQLTFAHEENGCFKVSIGFRTGGQL